VLFAPEQPRRSIPALPAHFARSYHLDDSPAPDCDLIPNTHDSTMSASAAQGGFVTANYVPGLGVVDPFGPPMHPVCGLLFYV
jgi:hypothetical protein